jgi:hypothetical protein
LPASGTALASESARITQPLDAEARRALETVFEAHGLNVVETKSESGVSASGAEAGGAAPRDEQQPANPSLDYDIPVKDSRQIDFRLQSSPHWGKLSPVQTDSATVSGSSTPTASSPSVASASQTQPSSVANTGQTGTKDPGATVKNSSLEGQAKTAVSTPSAAPVQGEIKNNISYNTGGKYLKKLSKYDGIEDAPRAKAMNTSESTQTTKRSAGEKPVVSSSDLGSADQVKASLSGTGVDHASSDVAPALDKTLANTALRTVEIVRDVSERMNGNVHRKIEFDIKLEGGEQVSVSLDIRRGEVRTTFRSDSKELREAISREWQVSMPATIQGVEAVKMTDPSFAPGTHSRADANLMNSDGQASRQQQQQAQEQQSQRTLPDSFTSTRQAQDQDEGLRDQPILPNNQAKDGAVRLRAFA